MSKSKNASVLFAPLTAALAACFEPNIFLPLEVERDQVLIYAATSEEGPIAGLILADTSPISIDAPLGVHDGPIFTWVLDRSELRNGAGEQLSDDQLRALKVRHAGRPSPAGACGRCQVPAFRAPQVLLPGDSCAPPAFARGTIFVDRAGYRPSDASQDLAHLEEARRSLRIEVDGACACELPDSPTQDALRIEPLLPLDGPSTFDQIALRPDGSFLAIRDPRFAVFFDAQGEITKTIDPKLTEAASDVIALESGQFLVNSILQEKQSEIYGMLTRIDPERGTAKLINDNAIAYGTMIPFGPEQIFIAGLALGGLGSIVSAIASCHLAGDGWCSKMELDYCAPDADNRLEHGLIMDNGVAIVSDGYHVFRLPAASDGPRPDLEATWTCDPLPLQLKDLDGQDFAEGTLRITALGKLGDRLFAAAYLDGSSCVLVTAVIGPEAPEWKGSIALDSFLCGDFAHSPLAPDQLRYLSADRTMELSPDGRASEVVDARLPLQFNRRAVTDYTSNTTLLRTDSNGIFRARGAETFTQLYGPPSSQPSEPLAPLVIDGRVVLFGHSAQTVQLSFEGGTVKTQFAPASLAILGDGEKAMAIARDSRSNGAVLVGYRVGADVPFREPIVRRLELVGPKVIASEPLIMPSDMPSGELERIVERWPGSFVAIGTKGIVLEIDDQGVRPLLVEWDDPSTEEVEMAPAELDPWHAIDVRDGVVWLSGGRELVARLTGDRVERLVIEQAPPDVSTGVQPRSFRALKAVCADRVVLGSRFIQAPLTYPELWEVVWADRFERVEYPSLVHKLIPRGTTQLSAPVEIFGEGSNLTVVFDDGTVHRFGQGSADVRLSGSSFQSIAVPGGGAVFCTGEGRASVGLPIAGSP